MHINNILRLILTVCLQDCFVHANSILNNQKLISIKESAPRK